MKRLFGAFIFISVVALMVGAAALVWGYNYISRDLPRLDRVEDYRPPLVSQVVDVEGNLLAEFSYQRRYPMSISAVPRYVRDAFVAAEDSNFYTHPGIDLMSIARAFLKNMTEGEVRQGGSTITQQVVKNLLLTPEKSFDRKIKEAILSYRLETRLTKDEILEIYLNQIFFGSTAYGLRAASYVYFRKDVGELTLAEGAMLAGLPPAPSLYSPIRNFDLAKKRQQYVLDQMVVAGFISEAISRAATEEEVTIHAIPKNNIFSAPYYVSEVRRQLLENFKHLDPDRDGLTIKVSVDTRAVAHAKKALTSGLEEVDKRVGWRGPVARLGKNSFQNYLQNYEVTSDSFDRTHAYVEKTLNQNRLSIRVGEERAVLDLSQTRWIQRLLEDGRVRQIQPSTFLKEGDVVTVRYDSEKKVYVVDQAPELEGAVAIAEVKSGRVITAVGGYDYSRSQFNRVTQAMRQPGSAFKPIVYLAAIDGFGYSPSTQVDDSPRAFRVGDQIWEPGNYDRSFKGAVTLRNALEQSRNLASADIISKIGTAAVIRYSRSLGITSPLQPNLSLALGSNEVRPIELLTAYTAIANNGVYIPLTFIDSIHSRDGELIYDASEKQIKEINQAVKPASAFVLANMMKGVVQSGTGWRLRELGRPIAGKTGTSNDFMDAWFAGMTPEYSAVVWVGHDVKKKIGDKETGGRIAAPIFLHALKPFLDEREKIRYEEMTKKAEQEAQALGLPFVEPELSDAPDFLPPETGVSGVWVKKSTGEAATAEQEGVIFDYFVEGTEPSVSNAMEKVRSYLESPDL